MSEQTYHFRNVDHCEMCGSTDAKLLGMRLNQSQGFAPKTKSGIAVSIFRCRCCDFIYPSPEPRPGNLQDHYGIAPEDYWVPAYFEVGNDVFGSQISVTKTLLDFEPGMRAIDVGTGLGKGFAALASAGFDVWGIEPSETFHAKAIEQLGVSADRLRLKSVESADFDDNVFDFVNFDAVLEHLYDPASKIERAMKWLRPGGICYAEVPSSNHLIANLINHALALRGTSYVTHTSPMHSPFHIHEFSLNTFVRHAQRCGSYEVAEHKYSVCSIRHFPKILHPILRRIMEMTDTGMQLQIWLRKK